MIKVCDCCSHVDVETLKKAVGEDNVEVGCLEACGKYDKESYGYIGDAMIVEVDSDAWITKAKASLE